MPHHEVSSNGPHTRQVVLRRLSSPLSQLAKTMAVLIMLTSSFDLFLVIQAGGTLRFCEILTALTLILALVRISSGTSLPVLGLKPLVAWFVFQVLFIPVAGFWPKSLAYCLWLALNIGLVFSFVQLFGDSPRSVMFLLRAYIYSFGLAATFGIVQFLLGVTGLPAPFVAQWWVEDVLPRANGFSYEPSYFACYLLIGFVFVGALRHSSCTLVSQPILRATYYVTAIAIVLSSSRIGIGFLLLDMLLYYSKPWFALIKRLLQMRIAAPRVGELVPLLVLTGVVLAVVGEGISMLQTNPIPVLALLNGTGIAGTHAHSVVERGTSLVDTLTVFEQHPIIGQSLGGVSSAVADLHGETISSIEDSKLFEGMSVFAETLAASGIVGLVPFVIFLVVTIRNPMRLARLVSPEYSSLLRASVRALLFAWAALQFNQNILRPYLWVHIGILMMIYSAAVRSRTAKIECVERSVSS